MIHTLVQKQTKKDDIFVSMGRFIEPFCRGVESKWNASALERNRNGGEISLTQRMM